MDCVSKPPAINSSSYFDAKNGSISNLAKKAPPLQRHNTMKQKESKYELIEKHSYKMVRRSRLDERHLSENSNSLLFIDGPMIGHNNH